MGEFLKSVLSFFLLLGIFSHHVSTVASSSSSSPLFQLFNEQTPTINVILTMTHGTTNDILTSIQDTQFPSRALRVSHLVGGLKLQAANSQRDILDFLTGEQERRQRNASKNVATPDLGQLLTVSSLWITNQVLVRGVDRELLQKLEDRIGSDVLKIEQELIDYIPQPVNERSGLGSGYSYKHKMSGQNVSKAEVIDPFTTWGVHRIGAESVWESGFTGKGILIASIDTGVRRTHEALKNNHEEGMWFDPIGKQAQPYDDQGHGTHTVGTVLGDGGIGVAPGAKWGACKACNAQGACARGDQLQCGQWVLCPTGPQCENVPSIVVNSWGGGPDGVGLGSDWFGDVLKAWREAGIIPVFSIGNDGPHCGTLGYPGTSPEVIGVGSTTYTNTVSEFSSVGPQRRANGEITQKPEVVAPGSNIQSAGAAADDAYVSMSGTSMACPHVAGLVALLLEKNPKLTFDEVKNALIETAGPTKATGGNCGDLDEESEYPNHHVGYGLVNGPRAIDYVKASAGQIVGQPLFLVASLAVFTGFLRFF